MTSLNGRPTSMKKKITKKKQPARKRATTKRKVKRKMATATEERPPATHAAKTEKKEESEKEKADKALEERLKVEGPSTLLVEPPKTAVDTLRDNGFPVVEIAVAPLPGGGPSAQPGMSAGSPPPTAEDIQDGLDAQEKELEKKNKERDKQLEDRKKQEKERLDAQKKSAKKAA